MNNRAFATEALLRKINQIELDAEAFTKGLETFCRTYSPLTTEEKTALIKCWESLKAQHAKLQADLVQAERFDALADTAKVELVQ